MAAGNEDVAHRGAHLTGMEDSHAHDPRAYAVTLLPVRRLVVIVTLFVALAGSIDAADARSAHGAIDDQPTSLAWRDCGESFDCASLPVPLDYSKPDGATIDLAVIRHRGQGARRIGSLVLNPGGPGAPAVSYLRGIADLLHASSASASIWCRSTRAGPVRATPSSATATSTRSSTRTSRRATARSGELVAAFRSLVESCARASGPVLPHVGTVDTARDLDRLRAAMGDETLSFVGQSYGTYLGTNYASMFAGRVRSIVLDGAIDPGASGDAVALGQARGFERALDDFLADCAANRACPFHHDGRAGAAYDALRARAERAPLATLRNADRTVNGTRFDAGVLGALYAGRAGWKALAQALADAEDGNAATLLGYADAFVDRESAGTRHQALDAFWAITCLDGPPVGDVAAAARLEARAARGAAAGRVPRQLQPAVLDVARPSRRTAPRAHRGRCAADPRHRDDGRPRDASRLGVAPRAVARPCGAARRCG